MYRLLEILLGLPRGFLAKNGELSLSFHPHWPGEGLVGAWPWNLGLMIAIGALVWWVYRREGTDQRKRMVLAGLRGVSLLLVLAILNRPILTLVQTRVEPSVLPVLIDTSLSMEVPDVKEGNADITRMEAVKKLLANASPLVKQLAGEHQVRLYRFDNDAGAVEDPQLEKLHAEGGSTQITQSIRTVLDELRGQRVAGLVILTDGRQVPASETQNDLEAIKDFGVKIYPVPVGTEAATKNVRIENFVLQDVAFLGDLIDARATVKANGFGDHVSVKMVLKNGKTGETLPLADGSEEEIVNLADNEPTMVELPYKPGQTGPLDLQVEAVPLPGEIDKSDNVRSGQVFVMEAKIAVLYVDGYPRWDYRYIKNEMIRDKTVDISCLLTSSDPQFIQEGDIPIRRFPESMDELSNYDVVLLGDVDPRQFSDSQLQLISDFVAKQGGGLGMVAGPRWSPAAWRGTPIEPILPVNISQVMSDDQQTIISDSFRPIITPAGLASGIFRFLPSVQANADYLKNDWPTIYWFCRGITAKPGVGEVYAEHPNAPGPDSKPAPLMVFGRFGAGRTMFSAIDDSWRWRFYTGENVFDTYWVQTLRQLSRGRKLGQRRFAFSAGQPIYDLGNRAQFTLRLLDPHMSADLGDQVKLQLHDATGELIAQPVLVRDSTQRDLYSGTWQANRVGHFVIELPALESGLEPADVMVDVQTPQLELADPRVDLGMLNRLAGETFGQVVQLDQANQLPRLIPSAAKVIPVIAEQVIWNSPLAMVIIAGLVIAEWILRKVWGLV